MNVAIEVQLAIDRALAQTDALFDKFQRVQAVASNISVSAANIRLPNVTGGGSGGSGSGGNNSQAASQLASLTAAIARQRATAQTAWQATAQMNATISASTAAANAAATAVNALAAAQARQAAAGHNAAAAQNQNVQANNNLLAGLTRMAAGYLTVSAAFNFTKDAVAQAIAVENLTNTLSATSGSAKQAASDLAFLRAESQRIGVNFIDSSREFVKFNVALDAAGMSAQVGRDAFTALAEAGRRMGLTSQQQASTFLALEQMISKGTVSAQELRLQLGNALPGALQIAARSMGLTTKELQKLVESGNLASTEFLPKFIGQLQKELPATAETLASTSAELARLGNQWQDFKAKLGQNLPVKQGIGFVSGAVEIASAMVDNRSAAEIGAARSPERKRRAQIASMLTAGDDSFLSGADDVDIDRWAGMEARLQAQAERRKKNLQQEAERISGSDQISENEIQRAQKFWKTYRQLELQTLDEEDNKRQEIIQRYDDAISKIRENREGFSQGMIGELVSVAEAARENQLAIFDEKQWQESLQEAEKDWQDFLENSRRMAKESKKEEEALPRTPLSRNFGDLRAQRGVLMEQMFAANTVEDFQNTSTRIGQINQAMFAQLRANQVEWQDSFTFGIDEVVERWGSASERMANVGAGVAESIQSNMTEGLTRAILETENAQQAFADMANAIVADLLKIAIQELFVKQIVSGLGGLFGAAAHTGAVIGSGGSTTQFAPRFHAGGAVGDEQLIMGRRGEVVFTPEQMKMLAGGQKQTGKGVEILNVFDEKLIDQRLAANPDLVVNAIGRRRGAIRALLQ